MGHGHDHLLHKALALVAAVPEFDDVIALLRCFAVIEPGRLDHRTEAVCAFMGVHFLGVARGEWVRYR